MSEITTTNNDHRMLLVHTQNLADLIIQEFHIISISLLSKSAKIVQILPDLRCRHLHFRAQLTGRNALDSIIQHLAKISVISRKPFDYRF